MNIFQKVRKEADRPLLTYSFAGKGSDSLYEYLYKCIKNDILSRDLAAGTRLPSKRGFAKNLGISVITVENAYAQLQAEGYIYSLPKKGYYVNAIPAGDGVLPPGPATAARRDTPEDGAVRDDLVSPPTRPDLFPFSIWTRLTREVLGDGYDDLLTPSPGGGVMALRVAIADYLRQFRDMRVAPEQIVVGAGTEYLYGLIVQLLGFDRVYAVENPGYKKLAQIYRSHRVACRYVAMDGEGVAIPALEASGADVLHISPGHHFPTGIVTPVGRRYELLGWAAREDSRFIIEDDFDSEFRMTGRPIPMLQTIDVSEKVIYMNTFSKSLSSTIRISYMVLPPRLAARFYENLSFYNCTVSTFEQTILARFIEEGYFEKHIGRSRNHYKNVRNELLRLIKKSPLAAVAAVTGEDAGLHFLMHLDTGLSDEEIREAARRQQIRVACLSDYELTDQKTDTGTLVMNYSGLGEDGLEDFVGRLSRALVGNSEA